MYFIYKKRTCLAGNGIQQGQISTEEPVSHINSNKQELKLAFAALDVDGDGVLSKVSIYQLDVFIS